ncbi:MAG TPA: Xaa-Pro aminopeptidase [Longimicrobiales bacterium]|nr:Xaa-Pro aminopeptidase [Longimicrobiales bacterium]
MQFNSLSMRFASALAVGLAGSITAPAAAQDTALTWQIPELGPPEPIRPEEFAARRRALADSIGDGVLVIFGARAPAADYLPYQQSPAFRYLTGVEEPEATLIIHKTGGRITERLFVLPRNPAREVWEGARLGPEGARSQTGIASQPSDRVLAVLDSLLALTPALYSLGAAATSVPVSANLGYEQQVLGRLVAKQPKLQLKSIQYPLSTLRGGKSPAELDRLRRATYISAEAHRQAMQATEPRMNEFEIRALVEYTFLRHGGDGPSYASIVGSGPNSTTLHYNADNRCMNDGEVLLFDVAAYYAGYASDVTRTIPVNGKFTAEQRAIYEIVLAAQKAAEQKIQRGATWKDLNDAARGELARGLVRLGLIESVEATYEAGTAQSPQKRPQLGLFYMHGLGHGIGLDVHDPDISTTGGFQPGSAVTIEPGLYIRADVFDYLPDTPANRAMIERLRSAVRRYANIGVRIEDVYIFDQNGVERASRGAPREIDEIESLMRVKTPLTSGRRADVVEWRCPKVRA